MSNYPLRNRSGATMVASTDDKENNAANAIAGLVSSLKDAGVKESLKELGKTKGRQPTKGKEGVTEDPPPVGGKREARKPLGAKDTVPNLHSTKENANTKVTKPKESKPATKKTSKNVPAPIEDANTTTQAVEVREPTRKTRAAKNAETAKADALKAAIVEAQSSKITTTITTTTTTKSVELALVAPTADVVPAKVLQEIEPQSPQRQTPVDDSAQQNQQDWDDLDADDAHDPVMVSEYVVEIFDYMRRLELRTLAEPNYMEHQQELSWTMRAILVDWIVDVHNKFRLLPETLYLTVNIIDRFLSARVVSLSKLQLVGITALFIASKYEEIVAPSIENLLYMAENGYTQDEVVRAERYVLGALEFSIQYQSPMSFLRRGSKADNYDIQTRTLAKYLMEVSVIDHRFLVCPPSEVAAAGLYLARRMLERGDWDTNLTHYTGYSEEQLAPCANLMLDFLSHPTQHDAVYRKYSGKKFMRASVYVKDWIEKNPSANVIA